MLKTALFLLCSVAILVSGADNAAITESPSNGTSQTTEKNVTSSIPTKPTTPLSTTTMSSTSVSTTSSTPATTTTSPTPAPTPTPDPSTQTWVVNGTDDTCIIATMALQFKLTYNTTENKTAQLTLNLPTNNRTNVQGTCGNATDLEQNLTLTWQPENNNTETANNLTLHFVKNTKNKQYSLHHIELYLAPEEFPNIQSNYSTSFIHKSDLFTTALGNSYRCLRVQSLNITGVDDKNKTDKIEVSHLQFQAFHSGNTTHFGFAEDCAFDTPDIVPIAVGCALATLVVFVLIAYLAARRHSQARGYLSM